MSRFIFRLQVVGATTAFMLRDWTRIPNTVSDNFKSNGFGIHNMHSFIQSIILVFRASVSVFEWVTQLRTRIAFGYRDTNVLPAKCLGCCLLHNALSTTIDYKDGNKLQPRL